LGKPLMLAALKPKACMASALKALEIGKNGRAIANSVIIIFFILVVSSKNILQNQYRGHILLTKLNLQVINNHLLIT
jgi:hypothetical protein